MDPSSARNTIRFAADVRSPSLPLHDREHMMKKLVFGYASLGLLVGVLTGLSNSPIASSLLAGLFAFAGGGLGFLIEKLNKSEAAELGGSALTAFSLLCLAGILGGLTIRLNDLLTLRHPTPSPSPLATEVRPDAGATAAPQPRPTVYLQDEQVDVLESLDQQCRTEARAIGPLCCDKFEKGWKKP
jgi:hypothetical protein